MAFERFFLPKEVDALKREKVFKECLYSDIVDPGEERQLSKGVFPAVRAGRIDFYHRGGKLFSYFNPGGFRTHHKYASVLKCAEKRSYITEKELQEIPKVSGFTDRIEGERRDRKSVV